MRTDLFQSCGHCWVFHKGLECKSRKSRDTRSIRHIWPWSTKYSRILKANRNFPRECIGHSKLPLLFFFPVYLFYFTILYWFCYTLTWIHHGCACVLHPETPSYLPPHPIPLGHPSAPAPSTLYHASNLDWWFISHMIIYMFQCPSPISSCPSPLPQSPKDCSIHLCLFCCLAYRVIVTFFLNSIYIH